MPFTAQQWWIAAGNGMTYMVETRLRMMMSQKHEETSATKTHAKTELVRFLFENT